jgi:hypothetical protein
VNEERDPASFAETVALGVVGGLLALCAWLLFQAVFA